MESTDGLTAGCECLRSMEEMRVYGQQLWQACQQTSALYKQFRATQVQHPDRVKWFVDRITSEQRSMIHNDKLIAALEQRHLLH